MACTKTLAAVALAAASALSGVATQAACLSDAQVDALAQAIADKRPAATPEGLSDADAACTAGKLRGHLAQRYGAVIGYKAGLTNPAVQKRFKTDKPVWGALYQGMLLDSGAVVDAAFGARPLYEADMLVRVKSAAINQAKTPEDVLAAVDQIIPFIELPDLAVEAPPKLDGAGVAAINVGARLGVRGAPLAVPAGAAEQTALLDQLRDMTVRLNDGNGNTEIARGKGSDILGHPLNAVVWLAQALAKEGLAMQPGEFISLGSFSPLTPPKPGQTVVLSYDGLPGAQPTVVSFK